MRGRCRPARRTSRSPDPGFASGSGPDRSRARREFSHGCVRVEDPAALAEWVLKDQREWTRKRIVAAMSGPRPQRVDLTHPIPVIPFYVTAVVMPEDGTLRFAEDIYRHDERLDRALTAPAAGPTPLRTAT